MDQKEFDAFVAQQQKLVNRTKQEFMHKPLKDFDLIPGVLKTGIFDVAFRNTEYRHYVKGVNQALRSMAKQYGLKYHPFTDDTVF